MADPVVQLSRKEPPFRLLNLDQTPGSGFQAIGVAVEVFLGALALGDVVSDLGKAARFSCLVEQGRDDDVGPELRPVLAHAPALAFVSPLDRSELKLHSGIAPGGVIGREKARVMLADDLFGAVPLDALRPKVPAGDVPVHVQNVDGVIADVLHHHPEPFLAPAHLLFGALPVVDVLADADDPPRPARFVALNATPLRPPPDAP